MKETGSVFDPENEENERSGCCSLTNNQDECLVTLFYPVIIPEDFHADSQGHVI